MRGIFILIAVALMIGRGPDPTKQALLEQLVTTQSTIIAGVMQITLRDREIALRTAAKLADDRLTDSQRNAVIGAISQARAGWVDETDVVQRGEHVVVEPLLRRRVTELDAAIASLR
jgi:hypothetical protein